MYDDVLFPVAPESEATWALPAVVGLARRYDSTVHVLAAADTMETTLGEPRIGALAGRVEDAARDRTREVRERLESEGIDVRVYVDRGAPSDVILQAIDETGADVVVMPKHTRRGLERVLLGSVAEKVLRRSPVPVLTIPAPEE